MQMLSFGVTWLTGLDRNRSRRGQDGFELLSGELFGPEIRHLDIEIRTRGPAGRSIRSAQDPFYLD